MVVVVAALFCSFQLTHVLNLTISFLSDNLVSKMNLSPVQGAIFPTGNVPQEEGWL